ncbi:hypothetical protein FOD75_10720 (plasmid) [Limosilactobacillus reuteri]|uniref:Uncharacterized protein n=1 Tax=Limosilactobacillus reuteri TaxID=1598 RepID=A0A517D8B0_LIMRT|nr:hypothetical protein [Limosilactobacillus reuteri]QDR73564.1 hypothetical protein FOD75_10720 [Limosilactobacillus reuteri]
MKKQKVARVQFRLYPDDDDIRRFLSKQKIMRQSLRLLILKAIEEYGYVDVADIIPTVDDHLKSISTTPIEEKERLKRNKGKVDVNEEQQSGKNESVGKSVIKDNKKAKKQSNQDKQKSEDDEDSLPLEDFFQAYTNDTI